MQDLNTAVRTKAIAILAMLFLPTAANAGLLSSHSLVIAQALEGQHRNTVSIESDGPGDTGLVTASIENDTIRGEARAITALNGGHFLRAESSAYHDFDFMESPRGFGEAIATWRDVAVIQGSNRPAFVALQFRLEGFVRAEGYPTVASLGVNVSTDVATGFDGFMLVGAADFRVDGDDNTSDFSITGFDDYTATDVGGGTVNVVATFHINAPYNEDLGGYDWGVALIAQSGAQSIGGPADARLGESYSLRSIGLQQVTDPDGNPISVTFDSGLIVAEPSSTALIGMAALALIGNFLRSKRGYSTRR